MRKFRIKLLAVTFIIFSHAYILSAQAIFPKGYFRSPLDIPLLLSGNFGEMRPSHFHTGLDFKTQGVEGQKIYAVADGFVSRIKVQAGGYGNAIYITHPNGYVSVYGHLQKYFGPMANYVLENQYKQKSFEINLFPPADKFILKKGDVIGLSGNTGNSGGPHLHFEIRHSKNEHPLNPMLFGFDVKDNIAPTVYSIAVYPLNNYSFVEGKNTVFINNVRNGTLTHNPIEAYGHLGFGISANDYLNGTYNSCGVYSIELFVDSILIYSSQVDELDFSELRYIQCHYDYKYKKETNKYMQKSFVAANNKLSIYRNVKNLGRVEIDDQELHLIQYVLTDAYNNTTKTTFRLKGKKPVGIEAKNIQSEYTMAMPCMIENKFENSEIKVIIPQSALYEDLFFNYSMDSSIVGTFSKWHHVHSDIVPLHKAAKLWINAKDLPTNLQAKAIIVSVSGNRKAPKISGVGGDYVSGWVQSSISTFGDYAIGVDTVAPSISPINIRDSMDMKVAKSIRFKIMDDLSGIKEYEGSIDGQWVLFRYDAKNNLIYYEFADHKISRGTSHKLVLKVADNKDNVAIYEANFKW